MFERRGFLLLAALAVAGNPWPGTCRGQVFERETKVTGPAGRTVDRRVQIERGPGGFERDIQVQRPGGTFSRSTTIQRGFGGPPPGRGYGFRPPFFPGPFVVPRPGPFWGFGITAMPIISIPIFGGGAAVAPAPVVAGGVVQPAAPQVAAAQPDPLDPVVLAAQKLQSFHWSSRRDGARELGMIGDSRGVPSLIHVLKFDSSKEVRAAAATSLGQIGGPEVELVLERSIIYEKKQEVKDAAAAALRVLRQRLAAQPVEVAPPQSHASRVLPSVRSDQAAESDVPRLMPLPSPSRPRTMTTRPQAMPAAPALDGPAADPAETTTGERVPPPPPSPVPPY